MVQKESRLKVVDNAGLIEVKCVHVYKKNKIGCVGDWILVSTRIRDISKNLMVKSKLFLSLIVSSRKFIKRNNGHYIFFDTNSVVTFFSKNNFKGTDILGPLAKESQIKKETGSFLIVSHSRNFL